MPTSISRVLRSHAWLLIVFVLAFGVQGAWAQPAETEGQHAETRAWRGPQPPQGQPWPDADGYWFQRSWFQMGDEFANPAVNNRFRVNDPYAATHPEFHTRSETKGNGMMLVPMRQSPVNIAAARLYLELWGGHPFTTHRRVSVNGRSTYPISVPVLSQCTHAYPIIPMLITDLVEGNNALQFNADGDQTFWGHFIVEEAAIDVLLPADNPLLSAYPAAFKRVPQVLYTQTTDMTHPDAERIEISLDIDESLYPSIERVDYFALYDGFDENGDGLTRDWHGMTKRKIPLGHLGSTEQPDYSLQWDTRMLPAQSDVQIRAMIHWKNAVEIRAEEEQRRDAGQRYWKSQALIYQTAPTPPIRLRHPPGIEVLILPATQMSEPFWSRADQPKSCEFIVGHQPANIQQAILQAAVWDGGRGTLKEYFTLTGHALPIAGDGKHDVILSALDVDPVWLNRGINQCVLRSDTLHHGIEMLAPGPSLTLRITSASQ